MEKTLRTLEHLAYVIECVLIDCMGDSKGELGNLVLALRSDSSYAIDENLDFADRMEDALIKFRDGDNGAAASVLVRTSRELWGRIIDTRGKFISSV